MDAAIDEYRHLLRQLKDEKLDIPNRNLDTGLLTRAADYNRCDRTYAELVRRLEKNDFRDVTPAVKANVLAFFSEGRPRTGSISPGEWKKVQSALLTLKSLPLPAASKAQPGK